MEITQILVLRIRSYKRIAFKQTYKINEVLISKQSKYTTGMSYWKVGEVTKITGIKITNNGIYYNIDATKYFVNEFKLISRPIQIKSNTYSIPVREDLMDVYFNFPNIEKRKRSGKIDKILN